MDLLLRTLTLVLFVAPGLALATTRARRPVAAMLGLTGAALAVAAVLGGDARTLDVTHAFAAYEGSEMVPRSFTIEQTTAPGWQWAALCAAWCWLWAGWCWRTAGNDLAQSNAVAGPLLLAWGGSALILGLQKLAAPAPVALGLDLGPLPPFEVALLPAMIAAAIGLARGRKLIHLILLLTICVAMAHLPLAIFGTIATREELGTYLDVHGIDLIANPLTRVSTPLEPKSSEQLGWLIWAPQLLMWPAFSVLSAGGAGFAAWMMFRHPK